jgi:hypothetical protein
MARLLREAIEADRYPLSPRVRRLKALLAKINAVPPTTSDRITFLANFEECLVPAFGMGG